MSTDGMRAVPGTSLYVPEGLETIAWQDLRDGDGMPVKRDNPDLIRVMEDLGITYDDFSDFHVDSFLKIEGVLQDSHWYDKKGRDRDAWQTTQKARHFVHNARNYTSSVPHLKIVPQYHIVPGSGRLYRDENEDGRIGGKGERKFDKAELAELERLGVKPSELKGMKFKEARLLLTGIHNIMGARTLGAKTEAYGRISRVLGEHAAVVKPMIDERVSDQFKEISSRIFQSLSEHIERIDIGSSTYDFVDVANNLEAVKASPFRIVADGQVGEMETTLTRKAALFAMSEVADAADSPGSKGAVRRFGYLIEDFGEAPLLADIAMHVKPLLGKYRASIRLARRMEADPQFKEMLEKKGVKSVDELARRLFSSFEDVAEIYGIDTYEDDLFEDLQETIAYRLKQAERSDKEG